MNLSSLKTTRLHSSIICMPSSRTTVVDSTYCLYGLDINANILHQKSLIKHMYAHKYSKAIAFDSGNNICFGATNLPGAYYGKVTFDHNDIDFKSTGWHSDEIETCVFSGDDRFLATGGRDGKVFIFDTQTMQPKAFLPFKPDYINSLAFNSNSTMLVAASHDNSVTLFDVRLQKVAIEFILGSVPERVAFFENDTKIFVVCKNGSTSIINIANQKLISTVAHIPYWPTAMILSKDEKFAIIGCRGPILYVINTQTNKLMLKATLGCDLGVASLKMSDGVLWVGFSDGRIDLYNTLTGANEFSICMNVKDFEGMSKLLDKNPFLLCVEGTLDSLNEEWITLRTSIEELILQSNIQEAIKMAAPFMFDSRMQDEFNAMINGNTKITELSNAIKCMDYEYAYNMIKDFPYLAKTQLYEGLESLWQKTITKARKALEQDINAINEVKEMLKNFAKVSTKKKMVFDLINNVAKFKNADELVRARDFKGYFVLTKTYTFLTQTETHKKIIALGDSLREKIIGLDDNKKYEEAIELCNVLHDFPGFNEFCTSTIAQCKVKITLEKMLSENSINAIFEFIYKYQYLESMDCIQKILADTDAVFALAADKAGKEGLEEAERILEPYKNIPYWAEKYKALIMDTKIEHMIRTFDNVADEERKRSVLEYIKKHGKEPRIENLCKKYGYKIG